MISNQLERIVYRILWLLRQQEKSNQYQQELSLINRLNKGEMPQLLPCDILDKFWIEKKINNYQEKLRCEYQFKDDDWSCVFACNLVDNIASLNNVFCFIKKGNEALCLFKIYVAKSESVFSFGFYPHKNAWSYWVDYLKDSNMYHIPICNMLFGKRLLKLTDVPSKDLEMWNFCLGGIE